MVMSIACHPAFNKAASYYGIEMRMVKLDSNENVRVSDLKARIDRNTIMVVASNPGFPHGNQEPIPEIAKLAKSKGIGCHVDSCLGGFILPWAK